MSAREPLPALLARLTAPGTLEDLVATCLPGGSFQLGGQEYRCGDIHGGPGQSLQVILDPRSRHRGRWKDFADSRPWGDPLDLIQATQRCRDPGEAIVWARRFLGDDPRRPSPRVRASAPDPARAEADRRAAADKAAAKRQRVRRIWEEARPLTLGDPVWTYLAGRGIDLARLPAVPRALRCHKGLVHPHDLRRGVDGKSAADTAARWPAMVAWITSWQVRGPEDAGALRPTGGVHVTYLAPGGAGKRPVTAWDAKNRPVDGPKRVVGPKRGGFIPLTRGVDGRRWADLPDLASVALSEGVEDALAYAIWVDPAARVAAAIDVGNLAAVALPPRVAEVLVIGQRDPVTSQAAGAVLAAEEALLGRGFAVPGIWLPTLSAAKDAADCAAVWSRGGRA